MDCDKILEVDKSIGFAMIVDSGGNVLEWKTHAKAMYMPKDIVEKFVGPWSAVVADVLLKMEDFFGRIDHVSIYHEKLDIIGFPADDKFIIITARKDMPTEIIPKIKRMLTGT